MDRFAHHCTMLIIFKLLFPVEDTLPYAVLLYRRRPIAQIPESIRH
jgi:hypothetical protein